jgi:ubiquinone/menaquinone biosynthesis C-methylase UbiE
MDARDMEFEDNFFDLTLFMGVLHHLPDDVVRACLLDIKRVLRRGGHVLVAEPIFTKNWLSTWFLDRDRGRYIRDEAGYESLFGGYTIIRKRHFKFSLHTFCSYVLAPLKPGS